MTGDGVNDVPALKKVDIGIVAADATDAARSASDIVLTKPGLRVISDALTSRAIFQRMQNYMDLKGNIIIVGLHYEGQFKKTTYVGGKHLVLSAVEVESFSYSVLMEFIKDNFHYSEIGGIYVNKGRKGGWQLLSNDKEVIELVEECASGYLVNFYIDNIVDKAIEPAPQLQPHLSPTLLRDYEKLKREKVRANNEIFAAVGLPQIVSSFNASAALNSKSKGKKEKEKEKDVEDLTHNIFQKMRENESVKTKKIEPGSRTRSRTNAAPATEKNSRTSSTAIERVVKVSNCSPPMKPTCTKIFRQFSSTGGPPPGTVAAYLALQERRTNNDAAPVNENVAEFEMEENADKEVEEGNIYFSFQLNCIMCLVIQFD
ncbi:hypothetical protein ACET3Z_010561 [Daucus carota]